MFVLLNVSEEMSECASYVSSAATTAAAAATTGAGVVSVREQATANLRLDLHGSISSSRELTKRNSAAAAAAGGRAVAVDRSNRKKSAANLGLNLHVDLL
jgi:hypothetical protein